MALRKLFIDKTFYCYDIIDLIVKYAEAYEQKPKYNLVMNELINVRDNNVFDEFPEDIEIEVENRHIAIFWINWQCYISRSRRKHIIFQKKIKDLVEDIKKIIKTIKYKLFELIIIRHIKNTFVIT